MEISLRRRSSFDQMNTQGYADEEQQMVIGQACDEIMETCRTRVFAGDLRGALRAGLIAEEVAPDCAAVLWCCALLNYVLGDNPATRDYHCKASRNEQSPHSITAENVFQDVWAEFMHFITCNLPSGLEWSVIDQVKCTKSLPALPSRFLSCFNSVKIHNAEEQEFHAEVHFIPVIARAGSDVRVTLKLVKVELGVSNFIKTRDFQGYFVYEFVIDASPCTAWKDDPCELIEVLDPGAERDLPVEEQRGSNYGAQIGMSGSTPGGNLTYGRYRAIGTSSFRQSMTASKAPDDNKVLTCTWKLNNYEDGQRFDDIVPSSSRKIPDLPFDPNENNCSHLTAGCLGTWKLTAEKARNLHYHFDWEFSLQAKLVLMPRSRFRDKLIHPCKPHCIIVEHRIVQMSDFSSTWKNQLLR